MKMPLLAILIATFYAPLVMHGETIVAMPPAEQKLFAKAESYEKKGKLLSAHKIYQELIHQPTGGRYKTKANRKLESLNMKLLFSKEKSAHTVIHEVKEGESLRAIAKKYKTTIDLIKKSNGLKGDTITPGMRLKVLKGTFSIKVDKSENKMTLFLEGKKFKTYPVSTGKKNSTPVGTFKIVTRLEHPTWYKTPTVVIPPGDPENDLGTRWMGFDKDSYGIHGTTEPETLGTQASSGCVRMKNRDVEELFTVIPYGTKVTIQD